jgi:hypothetical protein
VLTQDLAPAMPEQREAQGERRRGAGGSGQARRVPDATSSPRLCSDLFDQTIVPVYSFEISADNWAKLDADFHDLKEVLAGTPQTPYPIVFHYGAETVSNAAVRLRGKSSWVNTVMFDSNPKMQFDIKFDEYDTHQKFQGVGTLHFEMARDEWSFLSERVGNWRWQPQRRNSRRRSQRIASRSRCGPSIRRRWRESACRGRPLSSPPR